MAGEEITIEAVLQHAVDDGHPLADEANKTLEQGSLQGNSGASNPPAKATLTNTTWDADKEPPFAQLGDLRSVD